MKYVYEYKKIIVTSFLYFVIFFFLFYRIYYLVPGVLEQAGSCFLYPFFKLYQLCIKPIENKISEYKTITCLNDRISTLEKTNALLRAENIALKASQSFMEDIEEVVAFKKRYHESSMHTVHILACHKTDNEQYIYIDAGTASDITIDMIALYKNILVGRVVEVYPWYSKVQLITDPACTISVYDAQTKVRGIYRGNGSQMTHVNHLDSVNIGDELVSTGEGLLFPRGYLVSSIISCQRGDLYQDIKVVPAIDIDTIHYCVLVGHS